MEWFYNMLTTAGCIAEDASMFTGVASIVILYTTLIAIKSAIFPKR